MNFVDFLGAAAGAVTTLTFLPQLIKTWKNKSAKDVSLLMFVIAVVNEIMWITWAALLNPVNWTIIWTNGVLMAMALSIIYLKLRYK
ncbi:MAG: SemiSWEET family transporter [Chitinophagaceae bacterium]|nr:SemiSWEET family transporter [Chitinophagaceae bacterium]